MTQPLHWFALLTRSNFEQIVFDQITRKKINAFLPKTRKSSRRKDRKRIIEVPLFPGYLFVRSCFDAAHQLTILKTLGAVRLLGNGQGPTPIPDTQIDSLKIMTSTGTDLITGSCIRLKKGDPVMVLEGPMAGLKGEFFQYKGRGRVIVKISLLGQWAGVEMNEDNVEKIPSLLS
ncbi:MAG: UpxY family transcription antiterminator [Desulfotignum sp.]|nr:UpxY family transcription antiterminator [Desulfotignum sp.]MCF8112621.1 UpxY family transcription antiterminator [Desulfotignum sp.]MCF8125957.1 UpxY family transcription antiterminator [Desulfotignum sp.]